MPDFPLFLGPTINIFILFGMVQGGEGARGRFE